VERRRIGIRSGDVRRLLAAALIPLPSPAPSASPAAGPCASPALASIAVRPGIGRAPATGGAVCVAPPGVVALGAGYRAQVTAGATRQTLLVYPAAVALVGLPARSELILEPGLTFSRRAGGGRNGLAALSGQQDVGAGFQHVVSDKPWLQQAVEAFATFPTGYPSGPSGFSAGAPTYQLSYTVAFSLSARAGATLGLAALDSAGTNSAGAQQRYGGVQPAATLSYALSPAASLLLEDQIAAPGGPQGLTGNRALMGLQQAISPNVVLDAEYEINLLPAPGLSQHTVFEAGLTVQL
jgi:hypothetical protein